MLFAPTADKCGCRTGTLLRNRRRFKSASHRSARGRSNRRLRSPWSAVRCRCGLRLPKSFLTMCGSGLRPARPGAFGPKPPARLDQGHHGLPNQLPMTPRGNLKTAANSATGTAKVERNPTTPRVIRKNCRLAIDAQGAERLPEEVSSARVVIAG